MKYNKIIDLKRVSSKLRGIIEILEDGAVHNHYEDPEENYEGYGFLLRRHVVVAKMSSEDIVVYRQTDASLHEKFVEACEYKIRIGKITHTCSTPNPTKETE